MAGSDTDSEYESDAPGPSTKKKLRTEIVHKKCVTTYSRQDFKPSETQTTDNESPRGSPLQVLGDIVIEYDNNQMEVDDENTTIDHVQEPIQIIGCWFNKAPKTSTERGREFRARKALLKQQRTIEKRAKSAEATRRWRKEKKGVSESSKKQAKTAAQRMREYRERKKFNNPSGNNKEQSDVRDLTLTMKYDDITKHKKAHENFYQKFRKNPFGYSCTVCNRLWFKNDLKKASDHYEDLLKKITNINNINDAMICSSCKVALDKQNIPILSTYNGFEYPKTPSHLPKLDLVSERLISPRIPFVQIRRLRHVHGQIGRYGQIINVPVSVDTMVNQLPRDISDDHCIYVHIKRKRIHKSSYLKGLINKKNIKSWLQYLVNTPLYTHYNITINRGFLSDDDEDTKQIDNIDEVSEDIPIEESLTAQQHTLLWDDEKYLRIAPGDYNNPLSLLFDEHAEELSFPTIYLGQFRKFKKDIRVTPFMMASSELRRTDRRAITPYHLLYIAVKIMRLRIRDCLTEAFKHIEPNTNITREQIQSEEYINNCMESNLAFLRSIPNSTWYWAQRKKDLFAMIRQKGRPTAFMTLSANEIGWTDLLQLLYKLANNGADISERVASELSFIEKSTLVNEDAVTCAIYFNKLVNSLLSILQSKECSPFGRYRVAEYFKRIEFQHRGSPHAHILLWLENAPDNMIDENNSEVIHLIDSLVSVSASQASGNIRLQTHKHTFTCYKKIVANKPQKCRFEAPFMPCRITLNLTPMQKTDEHFQRYAKRYAEIRSSLESTDYNNIDDFYAKNNIQSDDEYRNILRAGITRPKIFYKRSPTEKWHNPFNPFVFSILRSNMDFQIITEEYSCATYVVEYVNKTHRGVSNLQRKIIEVMNEHPEFNIMDITRKMSVDMLNSVEMSSQEAAWYLLREPMSKSSDSVIYINTVWPIERQRIRKTQKELSELDENSTDIWKEDWFDKYQKRPDELSNITLAQFVAKFYQKKSGVYAERIVPKVIRFQNYDIAQDYNEYRREMVTLHIPFRNEIAESLAELKFINIYDENEALILERRKEFESNVDIEKTIEICRQLCHEDENPDDDETEIQDVANRFPEPNPFQQLYLNPNADVNMDLHLTTLSKKPAKPTPVKWSCPVKRACAATHITHATVVCPNCNTEMKLEDMKAPVVNSRTVIANVYHFLEREYSSLKEKFGDIDLSPLLKISERTAEATGVSEELVSEILKEELEFNEVLPQVKQAVKRKIDQDVLVKEERDQAEPEIEMVEIKQEVHDDETNMEQADPDSDTLAVHIAPADDHTHKEPPNPDSDMLAVHTAPADDHTHNSKQNFLLIDAGKIIMRQENVNEEPEEYTFHDPHTQGDTSSTEYSTNTDTNDDELSESDTEEDMNNEDPDIKIEELEFTEEGFT